MASASVSCRGPARGAEERVEVLGGLAGSGSAFGSTSARCPLQLPEEAFVRGQAIVLVFDVDEMEAPVVAIERFDRRHYPAAVADRGEHPGPGDGATRCGRRQCPAAFNVWGRLPRRGNRFRLGGPRASSGRGRRSAAARRGTATCGDRPRNVSSSDVIPIGSGAEEEVQRLREGGDIEKVV